MKERKVYVIITVISLCLFSLLGCDSNVTLENTPKQNIPPTATIQTEAVPEKSSRDFVYEKTCKNLDEQVEYFWNIHCPNTKLSMPILNVVPHYFTEDDVSNIAHALFGNAEYFDLGPESERKLSKREIEKRISLLEPYTSEDMRQRMLRAYYYDADVQGMIDAYWTAYADASEETSYEICDWTFQKESYYNDTRSPGFGSSNANMLQAMTTVENFDYFFSVATENTKSSKRNFFSAMLGDRSNPIEQDIIMAEICQTTEPTQKQVEAVALKAQEMLDKMMFGDFKVTETAIAPLTYGSTPRYAIQVKAVQYFSDCPILYGQTGKGVDNLNTELTEPSYPMTDIRFIFTADGVLISFSMDGILAIQSEKLQTVDLQPIEKLCEVAEYDLAKLDFCELDNRTGNNAQNISMYEDISFEDMGFRVEINDVQFGLARSGNDHGDDCYQYVPVALFVGNISCTEKRNSSIIKEFPATVVVVNAVDGSIP